MKELTIREFRASIGRLDEIAEEVGEITITKHGKPISSFTHSFKTKTSSTRRFA